MKFRVDGVVFRKLIHELVHMVCLSSKGKDTDLRVTATAENQVHVEIQDTLGYGWSVLTDNVTVTTPGYFYSSSSIFTNVKVDHKMFGEEKQDRVKVMKQMNAVADGEELPEEETTNTAAEPLWFDCTLQDTSLTIECRSLNWEYTVHREVEAFNKMVIENPEATLILQPYLAAQLSETVRRSVPFAKKFTKLGDQFASLSGVHLQTHTTDSGSIISIATTGGKDVYFDQLPVDVPLTEVSVLPPASFISNVFQVCDFNKSKKQLQIDVSANTIAIHTPRHYVTHQNLDKTQFPPVGDYLKKWLQEDHFGQLDFPVVRAHAYIGSVCTGIRKDVPIVFQHDDGDTETLIMTVDVSRRKGKIDFDIVGVQAPITISPDQKIRLHVGTFEKALETFYKEGLDNVVLTAYDPGAVLSANNDESQLKIALSYVGR